MSLPLPIDITLALLKTCVAIRRELERLRVRELRFQHLQLLQRLILVLRLFICQSLDLLLVLILDGFKIANSVCEATFLMFEVLDDLVLL